MTEKEIRIDLSESEGKLDHFWESTGFTPASWLLEKEMEQAIIYLGSLPGGGISFVRIHYLLDLVDVKGEDGDEGFPSYDWGKLDQGLDLLVDNGLRPFFELMGNPGDFFQDFQGERNLLAWKELVRKLVNRYARRYGEDEILSWYFETWNEPDIEHFWPYGIEEFLNYYDACVLGLEESGLDLRFGGPGTALTLSDTFKSFIDHCAQGTDRLKGGPVSLPDFISVHEKGVKSHPEDLKPDTSGICEREKDALDYYKRHSRLTDLPFINDECDPQTGWGRIHTWRALPYYAGIVAKVINQHLRGIMEEENGQYPVLSNDNGFLGSWGNRTHFTRLGAEEEREKGRFELLKKPVHNVMTLLSLLGEERVKVSGLGDPCERDLGGIATGDDKRVALLLYNSSDKINCSGKTKLNLSFEDLPFERFQLDSYGIGEDCSFPFRVWEELGAPERPSPSQWERIRSAEGLTLLSSTEKVPGEKGSFSLSFVLPRPGVRLLLLSGLDGDREPLAGPHKLEAHHYPGIIEDREDLLLSWTGGEGKEWRRVGSYEVLASSSSQGPYKRINEKPLLSTAYVHSRPAGSGPLHYKVRALGRHGEKSPSCEEVEA